MRIKGIDHVTINLKDVARSLWFYGELLGFERLPDVDMGDHLLRYFALPGGGRLELTEYRYETADCGNTACAGKPCGKAGLFRRADARSKRI